MVKNHQGRHDASFPADLASPEAKSLRRRRKVSSASLRLPQPLRPAYLLNYDWTGWPTSGTALPSATAETVRATSSAWETDVVLVVAERFRITNPELLGRVRDGAMAGAEEEGHRIVALSVMPDHTYGVAGEF